MLELFGDEIFAKDIVENDPTSIDDLFNVGVDCFTDSVNDFNFENVHFFEFGHRKMVLVMKDQEKIYFKGSLAVECLFGSVDIHGYTLSSNSDGPYLVVSGYGQSALCIFSIGHNDSSDLKNELLKRKIHGKLVNDILKVSSGSSVLILSKSDEFSDLYSHYFEKHIPSSRISGRDGKHVIFNKAEEWLSCMFDIYSGGRITHKMKYHPTLLKLSGAILGMEEPRILICGGKGVGKSTTLQFLVNRMFEKWKAVLVIDFDIGQPEFTIPGCVSVVLITHPLLGPSFTHLWKPLRSIALGFVNPDLCMVNYFFAIEEFNKFCQETKELIRIPWFINTMGYIKGFGMPFITRIINFFHPSHLVQINSAAELNLNVFPLTYENVTKIMESNSQNADLLPHYELISFPAPILKNVQSIPPKVAREIRVFSYLMFNRKQLFLKKVSLKHKSLDDIGLFKPNKIIAISIPWLGSNHSECIGFGVILKRDNDVIYFLTPLSEELITSSFDVSVMELGLHNVAWEKVNLFNQHISEEINLLGHKSMFLSSFLF